GPGRCRYRGREDPASKPRRTPMPNGSYSPPGPRSQTGAHLRRTTPAAGPGRVRGALQRTAPHHSRQLRPPRPDHPVADLRQKRIKRRPVLGGLINEYKRAA
ncbi:MAG TPA: hypothetical protein VFD73_18550, partial [Gemmatimonadales bacterium]|nr:hypothetical protein [Gemmatimonadales bacterium]